MITRRTKPYSGPRKCSRHCGAGCTLDEYQHVRATGRALKAECEGIMGGRWLLDVWDNLGWHCAVASPDGRITVHVDYFKPHDHRWAISFSAFLGNYAPRTRQAGGRYHAHGRTSRSAIRNVITQAQQDLARLGAHLSGLKAPA